MFLVLAFFTVSTISSVEFSIHPPANPLVFYPLSIVLVQAVGLSILLMFSLFQTVFQGPAEH